MQTHEGVVPSCPETSPFIRICKLFVGLCAVMLFAFVARAGNTYSGQLGNGYYKFNRPVNNGTLNDLSGQMVYFHAIFFRIAGDMPGNINVTLSGTGFTPQGNLYRYGNFDLSDPLYNLYGTGTGSFVVPNFAPGVDVPHVIIVSGTNPNDVGNFTVTITGPGAVNIEPDTDSKLAVWRQPSDVGIKVNTTANLSVWASGKQPHSFQWYYGPKPADHVSPDPAKAVPGATSFNFTTPPLANTTDFWCLINGNATSPNSVRSSEATVYASPGYVDFSGQLTAQHDTWDRTTVLGELSGRTPHYEVQTFRIFTSGNYVVTLNTPGFVGSMNWYAGKFFPVTPANNFYAGTIGEAAGSYSWTNFMAAGEYSLVISSDRNEDTGAYSGRVQAVSGNGVPVLLPPPNNLQMLNPPKDIAVMTNFTSFLKVGLEGAYPRFVQWYQGEVGNTSQPVSVGTNNTLSFPAYPTVRTNLYWVRISNNYNSVTSETVKVMVVDKHGSFSGRLRDGNRTWFAPNGKGGLMPNETYYKTFAFTANTLGNYKLTLDTTNFSGSVHLYSIKPWLPNQPNLNRYAAATDGPANRTELNFGIAVPSTFYVLISSRSAMQTGDYQGMITGPAPVVMHPHPTFAQQPQPATQYYWEGQNTLPISFVRGEANSTIKWATNEVDSAPIGEGDPGSTTYPAFSWGDISSEKVRVLRVRLENNYGYEDSDLARVRGYVPTVVGHPALNRTAQYGETVLNIATIGGAPFQADWYISSSTSTNLVRAHTLQAQSQTSMQVQQLTGYTTEPLNVGNHQIWIQATNRNGGVTFPKWNVTVTPRAVSVSVTTNTFTYTGQPVLLQPNYFSLFYNVPSDLPVVYTVNGVTNAPLPSAVGTHQVALTIVDPNYTGSWSGQIVIQKAVLDAYPEDRMAIAGSPPASYLVRYTGFLGSDNAAGVDSPPVGSVPNNCWNRFGQYPITLSGGSDNNYTFNYHTGTLTVASHPVLPLWQSTFTNELTNVTLIGDALVTNGVLSLTRAVNGQFGAFVVPGFGYPMRKLHVSFDLLIGGGSGADGFSFNFANNATNFDAGAEKGLGTGLSIAVDTYNNGGETVPSLAFKRGGTNVVVLHRPELRNNQPHRIALDMDGPAYDVWVDGTIVAHGFLSSLLIDWDWSFTFAARTGGVSDNHLVDNVVIGYRTRRVPLPNGSAGIDVDLTTGFGPNAHLVTISNNFPGRVLVTTSNLVASFQPGTNFTGTVPIFYKVGEGIMRTDVGRGDVALSLPYIDSAWADEPIMSYLAPGGMVPYLQKANSLSGPWRTVDAASSGYPFYLGYPDTATNAFYRLLVAPE